MTETAKEVIDRLQGEAGYATGGYVDRLVFSGLDVHEMLNEIEQAIDTDKLSVEKLQERCDRYEKALIEIQQLKRRDTTNLGMINKLQTIAKDALAAIGENHD